LLTSFTILCFGTGTISASFHDGGNLLSRKELFIISAMGSARTVAIDDPRKMHAETYTRLGQ
jgi:hypothetical protein